MKITKIAAAAFALCLMLTACGNDNDTDENSVSETSSTAITFDPDAEVETIYTGKAVENEEDLAIFKFSCTLPDGYETVVDGAEGKIYASPNGTVTVKAQNFKEEFQSLDIFADQACAGIKVSNMLNQADTEFSEPQKTTVAGFDAIKYDYTVTAYIYDYETDAEGNVKTDENGQPLTKNKRIYGEYVDQIYFFYSDEDVFYFVCEAKKENAEAAAKEFEQIVNSVKIAPPENS